MIGLSAVANRPPGALRLIPVLDPDNVGSGYQADTSGKVAATCISMFSFILLCCGMCCEGIGQRLSFALGVLEDFWPLMVLRGLWCGERRKNDGFAC